MRSERVRVLVEIALCVALAAVLNLPGLRIRLPINIAGGTVSLNMLPIFILALRRGLVPGLIAGVLYGFVDLLIDPFVVHPVQLILDYPLAYGLTGLAGLGSAMWHDRVRRGLVLQGAGTALPFLVLGGLGRFASHWLSGLVFFASSAPKGQPAWLYSLIYNGSYLVPSLVFAMAAALVVLPALERAVPSVVPLPPASSGLAT
jgi:thiamine transporter